jgi:hypothetical protein
LPKNPTISPPQNQTRVETNFIYLSNLNEGKNQLIGLLFYQHFQRKGLKPPQHNKTHNTHNSPTIKRNTHNTSTIPRILKTPSRNPPKTLRYISRYVQIYISKISQTYFKTQLIKKNPEKSPRF